MSRLLTLTLACLLLGCQGAEERQRDLLGLYLDQPDRLTSISVEVRWGDPKRKPEQVSPELRRMDLSWGDVPTVRLEKVVQLGPGEAITVRAGESARADVVAALRKLRDAGALRLPTSVAAGLPGERPADTFRVRLAGDAGPFELNRVMPVPDKRGVTSRQRAALAELWQTWYAVVDAQVTEALAAFGKRERALQGRIEALRRRIDDAEFDAAQDGKPPPDMTRRVRLEKQARALRTLVESFDRRVGPLDPDDASAGTRIVDRREVATLRDRAPLDAIGEGLDQIEAGLRRR